MKEENSDTRSIERKKHLAAVRQEILRLPPEEMLERILEEPHTAALVHSFPEEDLYFLIHGIGPADAGPLLKLANDKQWEYVLDHDIWRKDRMEIPSVTRWLDLMTHADPARLVRVVLEEKFEFIKLYLHHHIELKVREHDQDPSEFGKNFHTFDDVYYFRFLPEPPDAPGKEESGMDRDKILRRFLDTLSDYDHARFQTLLLESDTLLPAEIEEELFRKRNVRLAEKGFLPFDEAVGVYQPIQPKDLEQQPRKLLRRDTDPIMDLQVPQIPTDMLEEENLFTRGLRAISSEDILFQLQAEFAGLCNNLLSADQMQVRDRAQLRATVQKASGYLHIGLESLISEPDGRHAWGHAAQILERYPLIQLFRLGFAKILTLKWRAEHWRGESWFEREGLPLSFWDEEWVGVLGGLFLKRPLFFDPAASGKRYRDFRSEKDVVHTSRELDGIIAFDRLFSLMEARIEFTPGQFLTYKKLVLTLWARQYLGLERAGEPAPSDPSLSLAEFKQFYRDLFADDVDADPKRAKHIGESMKASFLEWASERSRLDVETISETLGFVLERVFQELEDELALVSSGDLDPRFISLFLVKAEGESNGSDVSG